MAALVQEGLGTEKTCRKYLELLSESPLNLMKRINLSGRIYYANVELVRALGGE